MKTHRAIAYSVAALSVVVVSPLLVPACVGYADCHDRGYCPGDSTAGGTAGGSAGAGVNAGNGGAAGDDGTAGSGATSGSSASGASAGGHSGASTAGSGPAGSGGVPPCDGDCKGSTPVCDEATNTCVECLSKVDCKSSKPACDTATKTCVECTATTDCKDTSKPFCDTTAQQCVACLKQADCTSPTASACSAGTCSACTQDADCSNIAGKGVCYAGTCVQCTVAKESACSGNSCDPATKQCTGTKVGTKDLCEACLADSECVGGNQADPDTRCVPMKFMGVARSGGFCLRRETKSCASPYVIAFNAASISGVASESYCGIDQNATRCEAVLDFVNSRPCPDSSDTSCGCVRDKNGTCTEVGQGGLCRKVLTAANTCTIPCAGTAQCGTPYTCPSVNYCH